MRQTSGWTGAVFGMTAWLVLLAAFAFARDRLLGGLVGVLAFVQIVAALLLARLRREWGIHSTLGWFAAIAAPLALAALLAVDLAGQMHWLRYESGGSTFGVSPYWFLLVYPLLAVLFWGQGRNREVA